MILLNKVLEKTLESPLGSKEIKPVNPKGNQPWILIGKTDAEAPIAWPADAKSWLTGKDLDAGKDWGKEEKRVTKDEMVGWHHQLNALEFEQTRRQWRTGKPGILQLMGPQRVRHDLVCDWIRIRTRKEILTHVITWMNLEGIVLREVRQSWKNIYMYMLWIRRYV